VTFDSKRTHEPTQGFPEEVIHLPAVHLTEERMILSALRACLASAYPDQKLKVASVFFNRSDLNGYHTFLCGHIGLDFPRPQAIEGMEPAVEGFPVAAEEIESTLRGFLTWASPEQLYKVAHVFWSDKYYYEDWLTRVRTVLEDAYGRELPDPQYSDWLQAQEGMKF